MFSTNKFAFIDVETTGGNPQRDRIIEIGIVVYERGKQTKTYSSLINPLVYIPSEIRRLTGIDQKEVDKAPLFEEIYSTIKELLDGAIFVAHNARFDYGFIKHELTRCDYRYSAKTLCTVKLSRKLFPQYRNHNLDALIERFSLPCTNRHRAYDDALALVYFFKYLQNELGQETMDRHLKDLLKVPSLPKNIDSRQIETLPENPGVYLFYDHTGTLLYVGKSKNIKTRVKSHFTQDYTSPKELAITRSIAAIDTIETAGELGAYIRESELIKEFYPLYNRKLRRVRKLVAAVKEVNTEGYYTCKVGELISTEISGLENIVALFKSKKQAKEKLYLIAHNHRLCPKLLGLENTASYCFDYQLEKCNGACKGLENSLKYNIRYIEAFSNKQIIKWPYPSPIEIVEESLNFKEVHIVNNWMYLGSISINKNSNKTEILKTDNLFDWDIYQILKRYLNSGHINISYLDPKSKYPSLFSQT